MCRYDLAVTHVARFSSASTAKIVTCGGLITAPKSLMSYMPSFEMAVGPPWHSSGFRCGLAVRRSAVRFGRCDQLTCGLPPPSRAYAGRTKERRRLRAALAHCDAQLSGRAYSLPACALSYLIEHVSPTIRLITSEQVAHKDQNDPNNTMAASYNLCSLRTSP